LLFTFSHVVPFPTKENFTVNTNNRRFVVGGLLSLALLASACGSDSKSSDSTAAPTTAGGTETTAGSETTTAETTAPSNLEATLNASGATFPKTFYEEAIASFTEANSGVTINYGGGGSGKGRQDLADQIVDWAGTDGTIKEEDLAGFKGGDVLYFPTVVAPITVSYNLDGVEGLQLSAETIAKIFQAEITNWNDPAIAADNTGVTLPDQAITVVHRSESSGTTGNFTKFLEKAAGKDAGGVWKLGTDSTVEWPASTQGAEGNGGVASLLSATKGSIGYVDLSDAIDSNLVYAKVKNKAGKFVEATLDNASAAAEGAEIKDDLTFSAIWADGDAAYPITAQTWIIAYKKQTDAAKADALKAFIKYILTEGQTLAPTVNYAALPKALADKAIAQLDTFEMG
jgi:phosphate transport system substrate-binding protein